MFDIAVILFIFSLLLGFFFVFWGIRSKKGRVLFVGIALLLWDALLLASAIINNIDWFVMLLSFAMSAVLMWVSISAIEDALYCNQKISAVYVGYHSRKYRNSPIFEYEYEKSYYRQQVGTQLFSRRFLGRNFQEQKSCEIYINPKKPHRIVIKRKVQFSYIFVLLISLAFAALCIFSLLDWVFAWGMISI